MENIKKIWIKQDGTPVTTHYNGSWNVIKHNSTDDLDYSITIWETIYEAVEQAEISKALEEEVDMETCELTEEEWIAECAYILEEMADACGFELVKE